MTAAVEVPAVKSGSEHCELLKSYAARLLGNARAHYAMSAKLERQETRLTVTLIFFSVLTASLSTANWMTKDGTMSITVSVFSILTVALAAVQYALKQGEKSGLHKITGSQYAGIRREIEFLILEYEKTSNIKMEDVRMIFDRINIISNFAPTVDQKEWNCHNDIARLRKDVESKQ